jgi:hypothetical protein
MSMPVTPRPPHVAAGMRGGWYDPALRIGDTERGEVIDRLSAHYSDGRLDHAEFSERMDRAMTAKTMGDLAGLLSDLPGPAPASMPVSGSRRHQRRVLKLQLEHQRLQVRQQLHDQRRAARQQRMHSLRWLPVILAVLIAAIVVLHALTHSVIAWVLLAIGAFFWLRHTASRRGGGSGGG